MAAEDSRAGTRTAFLVYGIPLTNAEVFKYLRLIFTAKYEDWKEVVANLRKAINKWERISSILGREGENARTSGEFLKLFVQ